MKQQFSYKVLLLVFSILLFSCTDNYEEGMKSYNDKNYEKALKSFLNVAFNNDKFNDAQDRINEIDSILLERKIEKEKQDSLEIVLNEQNESDNFKSQLIREIESFNTFDGNKYRNDVNSIQIEIALFATWADLSKKAENHQDEEINKFGKTLNTKLIALQKTEFPKLRKNYGEILKQKLWEQNIEVTTKGTGHSTLDFVGAVFANNKNKQDMQESLSEIISLLRFKRVNYKWYKNDNEYTYFTIKTAQDGDLVKL